MQPHASIANLPNLDFMLIFEKIQVILRCRNPFLAFFSDCAVDFKGPTSDTFSYVFPIPSTEKQLKQL